MSIENEYKKWLEVQEYTYKEKNPYYVNDLELEKEIKELEAQNLNRFFGSDTPKLRRLEELRRKFKTQGNKYYEGRYKLKDKYAIDDTKRYETFHICGEDLKDAFVAGYELAKKEFNHD